MYKGVKRVFFRELSHMKGRVYAFGLYKIQWYSHKVLKNDPKIAFTGSKDKKLSNSVNTLIWAKKAISEC